MKKRELRKLREAIETRNIDGIISLAEEMPPKHAKEAERLLVSFYDHEVSVANAVIELIAYSKVYKSKIRPPLKGSFCFRISELRNSARR